MKQLRCGWTLPGIPLLSFILKIWIYLFIYFAAAYVCAWQEMQFDSRLLFVQDYMNEDMHI